MVFDDFEAFLRHFAFSTIINNFSTFFRRYFQPQKHFKKIENLSIWRPVDFISAKKTAIFFSMFPDLTDINGGYDPETSKELFLKLS